MVRVRTTKTASGKTAIQVVNSTHEKTQIVKHIGSASTHEEIAHLKRVGEQYIETHMGISPLFPELSSIERRRKVAEIMDSIEVKRARHVTVYELLCSWYRHCGFDQVDSDILRDLSLIRLVEPASKLRSVSLLSTHFLRKYSMTKVYKSMKTLHQLKETTESVAVQYAKTHYGFDFTLVFYDVTTLYFESFTPDELRKCGLSKDYKLNQPQIVVGLVVDQQGFPISYSLFEGNTFEGHTMIPVIMELKRRYQIKTLTIVADAAMVSYANMQALQESHISYIVGARLGNLPRPLIQTISSTLDHQESKYFSENTVRGTLICDYSRQRAMKDKSDRLKQLARSEMQMRYPGQVVKRAKFVKTTSPAQFVLNNDLLHKAELLEGIKGYYTNLTDTPESTIVARYHDLWHVEKSFRMAKSDLLARPIYHYVRQNIESHLLIVFISLCLAKSLELTANISIKRIIELLWEIEDVEFVDTSTEDTYYKRTTTDSTELMQLLKTIKSAY